MNTDNNALVTDGAFNETARMERFQTLQSGQYWRARELIIEQGIDKDEVLLIESLRCVENKPHTVILRPHPSKHGKSFQREFIDGDGHEVRKYYSYREHRFLIDDFLASFDFEPDHEVIRAAEIRGVQNKINLLQNELMEAQVDAAIIDKYVAEQLQAEAAEMPALPAPIPADTSAQAQVVSGTVANALSGGITVEGIEQLKAVANREHKIATIKAQWIQNKTSAIAETITALTPYFSEKAAAALAHTEDIRTYVKKLQEGIESLDLYVGTNVSVTQIRTGESAPKSVPLTFCQKKLLMDEEVAVFIDVDEYFDFQSFEQFAEALKTNDGLVNQIFPTERCVLVMASTARNIDYKDTWINAIRNKANREVFILVRDGMNIHCVESPVESHLGASRLFPSKDDAGEIFKGFNGSTIKFEDVAYTDKVKEHEAHALHYKRFLLLACGLDHRLKLFGDFYDGPQSLDFVSLRFQEQYCRFLHDADGWNMLPTEDRPDFRPWAKDMNSYLRPGSRVLCNWYVIMNPDTAPGACKNVSWKRDGFEFRYKPQFGRQSVAIAYKDGDSVCVDVEVSGDSYSTGKKRTFMCKVNLSKLGTRESDLRDYPMLCLDAVDPADLRWYVQNRRSRTDHIEYIRFFKLAIKFIEAEREVEADTRKRLSDAMLIGKVAPIEEHKQIIDQAVISWRAANKGKPLPMFTNGDAPVQWKSLLDQMYMLAGEGAKRVDAIAKFCEQLGYTPLRIVLSGNAKLMVYASPTMDEQDNRIEPHAWVHLITVEKGATRYLEKSRRWALLPAKSASETTVHEWKESENWAERKSGFDSYNQKQKIFESVLGLENKLATFLEPMDHATHADHLAHWLRMNRSLSKGSVADVDLAIPFGVAVNQSRQKALYACLYYPDVHILLYHLAPDEQTRLKVRTTYIGRFEDKDYAASTFDRQTTNKINWSIRFAAINNKCDRFYGNTDTGILSALRLAKNDGTNPMLHHWLQLLKQDRDYDIGKHLWMPEDLDLDKLVGNELPENYSPRVVSEVKLHTSADAKIVPKYQVFFDIRTPDQERSVDHMFRNGSSKDTLGEGYAQGANCGYGITRHTTLTVEDATALITERAKRLNPNARAVCASEVSDAPQPPEGVQRWVMVCE